MHFDFTNQIGRKKNSSKIWGPYGRYNNKSCPCENFCKYCAHFTSRGLDVWLPATSVRTRCYTSEYYDVRTS